MLLAGALLTDETVVRDDDAQLARWLAFVRLDDVLAVTKQLQLYLAAHDDELPPDDELERWVRGRRAEVLAHGGDDYRDISKPAAYTVFDGEDAFREELARFLLRPDRAAQRRSLVDRFDAWLADHAPDLPPRSAAVDFLVTSEFERGRDAEPVLVELGAIAYTSHPLIASLLRDGIRQGVHGPAPDGQLAELYRRLLAAYGLRMRDGLELPDLVLAGRSLLLGFIFHHRVWPEAADRRVVRGGQPGVEGDGRLLFAEAFDALLDGLTVPA